MFFFFSSRRRHTRYWRDWSSDVCSSDLLLEHRPACPLHPQLVERPHRVVLVEDADRRALALLRRQGRDTKVDAAILDVDADAAVLGDPLLGDVELAHEDRKSVV